MIEWQQQTAAVVTAAGMVSVQAQCTLAEAVALMQVRADGLPSETLESIARAVIDRRIRFDPAA